MNPSEMQARPARLASLAALVVLAAGCAASAGQTIGTSAGPRTTPASHAGFLAAIDQICARAVAAHTGHPFPVQGFDPDHPNPEQLPAVGTYFARYGGVSGTVASLRGLTPPAADAARWRRLLTTSQRIAVNAQHQIDAAHAKNVAIFVATVHTGQHLTDELNAIGGSFGFSSTSACSQVFG